MRRRDALKMLAGGAAALATRPAWSGGSSPADEFFIFVHAGGGWDVTLWADPRTERRGLIEPATASNTDTTGLKYWKHAGGSFEPLTSRTGLRLGPGIGSLYDLRERLTVINGIAMNTVSHEDGTTFSTTGRHRAGGAISESSIDVLIANELGTSQLMPLVAVKFPSAFVGERLDRRVVPLRVGSVDALTRSFARSSEYLHNEDREDITVLLTEEAHDLAIESTHPAVFEQLKSQHAALPKLLSGDFAKAFRAPQLQAAYPQFEYRGYQGASNVAAAFAIEAIKRNIVRCVGFSLGGFDTHGANQRQHALQLQELFGTIAGMVKLLDVTPHPTRRGAKLSDHTHILVVSEFCRTPQLNPNGGRDHYPNNSSLVISPRFRPGPFGATDLEQLLPTDAGEFADGRRPIAPPDVLATFLGAFGIDPRRYMRDGEVVKALLV
ncbi:MAG: hypothetical protein JWP01_3240 [Myxococcales bacterium]|nr:hypothetical protein [Myxococcales bacterium]